MKVKPKSTMLLLTIYSVDEDVLDILVQQTGKSAKSCETQVYMSEPYGDNSEATKSPKRNSCMHG